VKTLRTSAFLVLSLVLTTSTAAQPPPTLEQAEQWQKQYVEDYQATRYVAAIPVCQKVVEALERLAPEQPKLASALNDLGLLLFEGQAKYAKAEALLLRSLRIRERTLGPEHSDVAESLNNLALLYEELGEYHKAEPLLLRSLHILEKTLGPEHPTFAGRLVSLANLYGGQGELARAEPLLLRSLRIREKVLGPEHPDLATALNNLGNYYQKWGEFRKAEPLLLRSLRIRQKALGIEHRDVSQSLNNLGCLYRDHGNLPEAESLLRRALQIREKVFSLGHPKIGESFRNLADLYRAHGRYQQAKSFYLSSLEIFEKTLGFDHPKLAMGLNGLALLEVAQGQIDHALPYLTRALAIREKTLRHATTEARVSALLDLYRKEEEAIYSLLLQKGTPGVRELALTSSLMRKGRAAEAGMITGRAIWESLKSDPQRQRFQEWRALRGQRETLLLRGPGAQDQGAWNARLAGLQDQIETQEQELARTAPRLTTFRLPQPEALIPQVASRLPAEGALIEILLMTPWLFHSRGMEPKRGEPRYLALLLFPDGSTDFVDLGLAQPIEEAVAAFLLAARNPSKDPLPMAQALYHSIFAPLVPRLRGATRLYLSPDGSLNLIPFAALHDGQRYLIDTSYQLVHVSSGRDLLREPLGQPVERPLLLADPDYGQPLAAASPSGTRTIDVGLRGLYEGLVDLPRLPGARREGAIVGNLLGVHPLLDAAATEAAIRKARSPAVLHIATHGVFIEEYGSMNDRSLVKLVNPNAEGSMDQVLGRSKDFSLSRSALVLAGAAHASSAPDAAQDGLLTAEEARSLNLFGTQLVVLSACNTGRGSVKAGQGVYGLRRAFLLAGAETVVMSLWPVSDDMTQSLMQKYYLLLMDKRNPRSRVSGLSEAMKATKRDYPHPYYWAPFIALGRDAPLVLSP